MLQVSGADSFYGLSHILFKLSLDVRSGEVVCLLGRNGAGKSTTLRTIMGLVRPSAGSIVFLKNEIAGKMPYEIARLGIGYVPEERIIFPDLTVQENLEMGVKTGTMERRNWNCGRVYDLFPILSDRQKQFGGTLSGGEQQMLTIARTLMGNPKLLLLDEPIQGLAPVVATVLYRKIGLLKAEGTTMLISEQNSNLALNLSNRAYILEKGRIQWNGEISILRKTPDIMNRYLGV